MLLACERIRMVKNPSLARARGLRISALLLSLVLILSILSACAPVDYALEKEKLENRIENVSVESCASVVECFIRWKFPAGYDVKKLSDAEKTMRGGFYKEINVEAMAEEAAACFVRLYYDLVSFSDKTAYTDALIRCMVMALDDKYAVYRTEAEYEEYKESMSGSYGGVGMTVRKNYAEGTILIRRLVMDSPAERAGVLVGDLLHSVEGMLITKETIDEAFSRMSGDIGEAVSFTVLRNGEIIPFTIVRENMENMTVSYSISEERVAYIYVSSFKRSTYQYFKAAIEAATEAGAIGFVFDVRDNPGGYLSSVMNVLDCFVPDGTELLSYGAENETPTAYVASDDDVIDLPCVVLCGGTTASAGELFTAALQDYNDMGLLRVTVVGTAEATYGKGIMQSSYHLSDGSVLTMTSAFYNPPSGVNYHGVGVIPDVVCAEDTALDVAYRELFDLRNNK